MDAARIKALSDRWIAFELAGDPDGLLALCSDRIVLQPPQAPAIRGKAAVRAALSGPPPDRIELTDLWIECDDRIAWKRASFATWLRGQVTPIRGSHTWLVSAPGLVELVTWSFD